MFKWFLVCNHYFTKGFNFYSFTNNKISLNVNIPTHYEELSSVRSIYFDSPERMMRELRSFTGLNHILVHISIFFVWSVSGNMYETKTFSITLNTKPINSEGERDKKFPFQSS